MGGKKGDSAPPNPEQAARPPPHPAASSAHPRAEPEKPASDGAGVVLAKKCPLHLNFPAGPFACTARKGPPRLFSAALWALIPAFSAPWCPGPSIKPTAEEAQWARGHRCAVPRSPFPAEPSSPTLLARRNASLCNLGPRVCGPSAWLRTPLGVPVRSRCPPAPSASLRPPPGLGSAPRSPRPRSFHFLPRS